MHKLEKQVTGIINQFIIVIFRVGGPNERIRLATMTRKKFRTVVHLFKKASQLVNA